MSKFALSRPGIHRPSAAESHHSAGRFPQLRVLVAEDDPVSQRVLMHLLQRLGCLVDSVDDGDAAVACWASGGCDLILMDLQMPGMDGRQATDHIRRMEVARQLPRLPIVAVSADGMQADEALYRVAGFDAYMSKPVVAPQLIATLERVLHRDDSHHAAHALTAGAATELNDLNTVLGLEGHELQSWLQRLKQHLDQDLAQLDAALTGHSLSEVLSRTHRLQGSLGLISAECALRLCRSLDLAARSGNWLLCARTLHLLKQSVNAAVADAQPLP